MCVALPPTHVGGCTLYVGRSTMDDGLLKIGDFEGKLMSKCVRFQPKKVPFSTPESPKVPQEYIIERKLWNVGFVW